MAIAYYQVLFFISFLLSGIYVLIWRKHYDINITAIFILIPIANLGYVFLAKSVDAYDVHRLQMSVDEIKKVLMEKKVSFHSNELF